MATPPDGEQVVEAAGGEAIRELYAAGGEGAQALTDAVAAGWDDVRVEAEQVVVEGDRVAVFGTVHGTTEDGDGTARFAQLWELVDGRPSSIDLHLDGAAQARREVAELAGELADQAAALRAAWADLRRERDESRPQAPKPVEPSYGSHPASPPPMRRRGLFGRRR